MVPMNHARTHARTRAGPGPFCCNSPHTSIHPHESAPHPLLATPIFSICHSHPRTRTRVRAFFDVDKWRLTEMTTSLLMLSSDTSEDREKREEDRRTGREEDEGGCGPSTHTPSRHSSRTTGFRGGEGFWRS